MKTPAQSTTSRKLVFTSGSSKGVGSKKKVGGKVFTSGSPKGVGSKKKGGGESHNSRKGNTPFTLDDEISGDLDARSDDGSSISSWSGSRGRGR